MPVTTRQDLANLDEGDIIAGYTSAATTEPGSDRSRAFWHGWRNMMADRGLRPPDDAQRALARSVCRVGFQ